MHQFIDIDDSLRGRRIEWLFGIPQLLHRDDNNSFGIFAMDSLKTPYYSFRSPIRIDPLLQINHSGEKNQHISTLLISMLLQMEKDGRICLGDYPPVSIFLEDYTTELASFVNAYYEDNRRAFRGSNYA